MAAPSTSPEPVDADELLRRPFPEPGWQARLRAATGARPAWQVVAGALAVVLVAAATWWLLLRPPPAPDLASSLPMAGEPAAGAVGPPPTVSATTSAPAVAGGGVAAGPDEPAAEVVVHAAGAVVHPGVYRLPAGARVDDLVRIAGGLAPAADPVRLNLAALLLDGQRVYVPVLGEEVPPEVWPSGGAAGTGAGGAGVAAAAPLVPVDLNRATEAELDALPGIGPTTAAAIVAHRIANGPFAVVDGLLDVRGIGPAKLELLRPLVTAG